MLLPQMLIFLGAAYKLKLNQTDLNTDILIAQKC